ncbi:penicillin-binding transpeptidase domain-containing protein [Nonomuraea sp. NPDC059194]|uniref:penicillin-binding transpeptidase domain-containing protein n=1 Tax=Nonomuraea sp. NPDC059194 TaxID=3346764 RepID=UPI0036A9A993
MRRRRLIGLLVALGVVAGAGAFAFVASSGVHGSAMATASAYLEAWQRSDITSMEHLVADPPADFTDRHLAFSDQFRVNALTLKPGSLKVTGEETAELPFSGVRELTGMGPWAFAGTLRLAVRDGAWKVLWGPETLHPALGNGGALSLEEVEVPGVELVTRSGAAFPRDSGAEPYLDRLRERLGETNTGWAIRAAAQGAAGRTLVVFQPPPARKVHLTMSHPVQAAAARALDGVGQDAAIVAVKAGTGEILAVADRLGEAGAFDRLFPPGSTFKVVTAAGLLKAGMSASSAIACPPSHAGIRNSGDQTATTLAGAFAVSCNTTFVQQTLSRLGAARLEQAAAEWGFDGRKLPTGVGGLCGRVEQGADLSVLALNSIGQGTVEASPLCMAALAAAVDSGVWRSPRLVTAKAAKKLDGAPPPDMTMDQRVVQDLRTMMRQVVSEGTAKGAGLGAEVAGKTGTAEVPSGRPHAWFIGYQGDLAFCVFVKNGGSGAEVALPIAARFLGAL